MDISRLTKTAQDLVKILHDDLEQTLTDDERERITEVWNAMRDRGRTAEPVEAWQSLYLEQVAVAWVITTLFVRFLEDKGLIDTHWIAGQGAALYEAMEQQDAYFERHPTDSDADYLLHVFAQLASYDAGAVFRPNRNPLHRVRISGDAANALIKALREVETDDEGNERVVFAFGYSDHVDAGDRSSFSQTEGPVPSGETWRYDTRFLGDLYEKISAQVQSLYALCQTPDFVESFILDHTLTPAIKTFGADRVHLIDPTCGSGHFLLGAFHRLVERRRDAHPGETPRAQIADVLQRVAGVDINPFAAVITRFRLLVAVLDELNRGRATPMKLSQMPAFDFRVATGDALLLGKSDSQSELGLESSEYAIPEDLEQALDESVLAEEILQARYHAVVGNPPYKTVKDKAQRDTYRELYSRACHGKYALTCPFYERFHQLTIGDGTSGYWADGIGYVGQITSNSFMKRQFGTALIEKVIPETDITHVVDTSGAYIPGHGTPTVILFSRNQTPSSDKVRAVLGIRGEPSTPDEPSEGKVWSSIRDHVGDPGFQNNFVSVEDIDRSLLHEHPWTLKGGGALDAMSRLTESAADVVSDFAETVGITCFTLEDDFFIRTRGEFARQGYARARLRQMVLGEHLRDYHYDGDATAWFPYDKELEVSEMLSGAEEVAGFRHRTNLFSGTLFQGKTKRDVEMPWWEFGRLTTSKLRTPLSITFAEVATHNHFVLDRGGKVFKQTAPVIKLPEDTTVDDHLALLGPLNSSVGDFWAKMVYYPKGGDMMGDGARLAGEAWDDRYQRDSTKLQKFPLPEQPPTELARRLDALAHELAEYEPAAVAARGVPIKEALEEAHKHWTRIRGTMIALQEELDFACYGAYGLAESPPLSNAQTVSAAGSLDTPPDEELPEVRLGERPFEIAMARQVESGDLNTEWFRRHRSKAITEIPKRYPDWYKQLVQKRLDLIENNKFVRLIEAPEYKRRWSHDPWKKRVNQALEQWLRNRIETSSYLPWIDREQSATSPTMVSIRELCDKAARDGDFMAVGALYKGDTSFDYEKLVKELVLSDSVPSLPRDRFKKSGLTKYAKWEVTWDKQREEDRIDARHELPTDHDDYLNVEDVTRLKKALKIKKPPTYAKADFISKSNAYELRGKLDVPKERYTLHPGAELEMDGGAVITWAGFDHKQRAEAVIQRLTRLHSEEGKGAEKLMPLLAELEGLLPWLHQWHSEINPDFGASFADGAQSHYTGLLLQLGLSREEVDAYRVGKGG